MSMAANTLLHQMVHHDLNGEDREFKIRIFEKLQMYELTVTKCYYNLTYL